MILVSEKNIKQSQSNCQSQPAEETRLSKYTASAQ